MLSHRERPGNHGRPQDAQKTLEELIAALPDEQRRREREAAPRRACPKRVRASNPSAARPYVTGGAFALAFVFGAVGNKTRFCTMGAVSDWINMGEPEPHAHVAARHRGGAARLERAALGGVVDLSKSIYPGRTSPGSRTSSADSSSASA
jgi:hypothetical protein